jgi:hypothetical protein
MCNISKHNNIIQYVNIENMGGLEKMSRMLSLCNVELLQRISIFIKSISGLFQ